MLIAKGNSRKRWLVLLSIIAVAAAISLFHHGKAPPKPEALLPPGMFQATDAQWASLTFATVEQQVFHTTVRTDGKIANNDDTTTPVFSPYSGRVTKLFAKTGAPVERGDPLMALAAPDFTSARAQLKLATETEKRQHALYEAKTAPLKDWLQAQADLETAKGNFHAAEMEHAALRKRLHAIGKGDKEIAPLDAEAVVTAPIGGTVMGRQVGLGQYINSAAGGASTPVFSIGDLSTVWLLAYVREADASLMHVGDPIDVHVLAYPNRVFKAKLTYIAPAVDPTTHRLPVRAEINNSDRILKPEMFASFSITTDENTQAAPAIPEEAIIYEGDKAHVWVAQKNKKLLGLRSVRLGRNSGGKIEVIDGLKAGEMVVTGGSLFIDRAAKGDSGDSP